MNEITVVSSLAFKEALGRLAPRYARAHVTTVWAGGKEIPQRLHSGEVFDLVVMAAGAVDELIGEGVLAAGSRTDLATSGVGVAVRVGAPPVDIGSGDALKAALLGTRSLAYSSGPSGVFLRSLFQRWGIAEQLGPKIVEAAPGTPVGVLVAEGKAEIGFQQVCELLPVEGIAVLGPLPADIQNVTTFSAGVHVRANDPEAARELLAFLTSDAAAGVIRETGMEPA